MNDPNELKELREKHADVFENAVVDNVVYWREPVLGNGDPGSERPQLDIKKMTGILEDRTAQIFD